MFAYCLNNPVNGCDPCGTCFHNLKYYNCEKCEAFWNGVGQWCEDKYNRINGVYQQQTQLQTQITMQQNEMIANGAKTMWNAYERSNGLQVQQQYQQDMTVRKVADFLEDNPEIAIDVATGTIGTGLTYVGLGAAVAGVSIPVAGQIAIGVVGTVCGIWGLYRLGETIYQYIY